MFFGFLIPVAQVLFAALFALLLRANLPVAAVATLVSNPLTYGPIWVLAYRTGAALLGETPDVASVAQVKPLALGLAIFAVVGGVATWIAANLLWLLLARLRRPGPPG